MASKFITIIAALTVAVTAIPTSISPLTNSLVARQDACSAGNTATSRGCWSDGFDIDTNWYKSWPDTGVVREYWLNLVNTTINADGTERIALLYNNTFPGPLITADWGDTVKVHVTNNVENNGTSVHWHGIRQLHTPTQDGVNGIGECPIAPGKTRTYEWKATQYGTTWYHSHFSLQYGEGAMGQIVINGPATADYDVDVGPIFIQDWYSHPVFSLWEEARTTPNPVSSTGLFNGKGQFVCADDQQDCNGIEEYWTTTFESGKKYRLRFINTSVDTFWKIGLDGHNFTVIAADLVPIKPFETKYINIGMGERYDVIVEAKVNADVEKYWLRAYRQATCSSAATYDETVLAIIDYEGSQGDKPTTTDEQTPIDECIDLPASSLVPHVEIDVPESTDFQTLTIGLNTDDDTGHITWLIDGESLVVDWGNPVIEQVLQGEEIPTSTNTITIEGTDDDWVYFIITGILWHPIHLHGHDFFLLGQGAGTPDVSTFNFKNPPRRDVAQLPGAFTGGYLAFAFQTDSPGAWIAHCHIAWHVSGGLGWNFLERQAEISNYVSLDDEWADVCNDWNDYWPTSFYEQDDSGLRRPGNSTIGEDEDADKDGQSGI